MTFAHQFVVNMCMASGISVQQWQSCGGVTYETYGVTEVTLKTNDSNQVYNNADRGLQNLLSKLHFRVCNSNIFSSEEGLKWVCWGTANSTGTKINV